MSVDSLLKRLGARARMSEAPRVDVADRVMSQLEAPAYSSICYIQSETNDRAMIWAVAACVAIAAGLAVIALSVWKNWQDPLLVSLADLSWELWV